MTVKEAIAFFRVYMCVPVLLFVGCVLITGSGPCQDSYNPNPVWANDCSGYAYVIMDCENRSYRLRTVDSSGVGTNEHRAWQDFLWKEPAGRTQRMWRTRLEERFRKGSSETGVRLRQLLKDS